MRARTVTARRDHYCEMDFAHDRRIPKGTQYLVVTEYPNDEPGYASTAGHPIKWKICAGCAEQYTWGQL